MTRQASTTSEYVVRDQERMRKATRYFEWQAALATAHLGNRVLEIGCGMGNFTQHLVGREFVTGIDVEEACVERWRERFAGKVHMQAQHLDLLDPKCLELKKHNFDSIVCLNVLEHIKDDRLALQHMREILPPGGRAVLIIPAFEALYGPIDELLGHYRRYSKGPWGDLVNSVGFKPEVVRYINSIGCVGWWMNARVFKRTEQSEDQIAFFDKYLVPVLSRVEKVVSPPFGQSLFTVIEATA
jgi:SAM-dependent methyltransferase